jgi:hypothetical protein
MTKTVNEQCKKCGWNHFYPAGYSATVNCIRCGSLVILGLNEGDPRIVVESSKDFKLKLKVDGRKCWTKLHTMSNPNADKIGEWIKTIPNFSCGCQKFAREYIAANQPPYDNPDQFFEWTWRFHDAVDKKTGDERMTFEEAKAFWGSHRFTEQSGD